MHAALDVVHVAPGMAWASYPAKEGPVATGGPSAPIKEFKRKLLAPAIPIEAAGACCCRPAAARPPFFLLTTTVHASGATRSKTVSFGRLTLGIRPFHGRDAVAAVLRWTTRATPPSLRDSSLSSPDLREGRPSPRSRPPHPRHNREQKPHKSHLNESVSMPTS